MKTAEDAQLETRQVADRSAVAAPEKRKVERVDGIEPTIPLWKRGVLPLNYTRDGHEHILPGIRPVKPPFGSPDILRFLPNVNVNGVAREPSHSLL